MLNVAYGVNPAVRKIGDKYPDDAADAMSPDIVSVSRFQRTDQDARELYAKFELDPAGSGRHLPAASQAVFVPPFL